VEYDKAFEGIQRWGVSSCERCIIADYRPMDETVVGAATTFTC